MEFVEFPSIARLSREAIVTEKIDGTNAQIFISPERDIMLCGSRTRWIRPDDDNHGFARWAEDHREEIVSALGPGRHFGEWWGSGIQRGYRLQKGEKRFSLFNVIRWCRYGEEPKPILCGDPRIVKTQETLPPCIGLVPILTRGEFDNLDYGAIMATLKTEGSRAAPGFDRPEGIVVFHVAGNVGFKKTFEKDAGKTL